MSPIWTPYCLPPDPKEISGLSEEADVVWKALCAKHEARQQAYNQKQYHFPKRTNGTQTLGVGVGKDGNDYYKRMYEKQFGGQLPCSQYPRKTDTNAGPVLSKRTVPEMVYNGKLNMLGTPQEGKGIAHGQIGKAYSRTSSVRNGPPWLLPGHQIYNPSPNMTPAPIWIDASTPQNDASSSSSSSYYMLPGHNHASEITRHPGSTLSAICSPPSESQHIQTVSSIGDNTRSNSNRIPTFSNSPHQTQCTLLDPHLNTSIDMNSNKDVPERYDDGGHMTCFPESSQDIQLFDSTQPSQPQGSGECYLTQKASELADSPPLDLSGSDSSLIFTQPARKKQANITEVATGNEDSQLGEAVSLETLHDRDSENIMQTKLPQSGDPAGKCDSTEDCQGAVTEENESSAPVTSSQQVYMHTKERTACHTPCVPKSAEAPNSISSRLKQLVERDKFKVPSKDTNTSSTEDSLSAPDVSRNARGSKRMSKGKLFNTPFKKSRSEHKQLPVPDNQKMDSKQHKLIKVTCLSDKERQTITAGLKNAPEVALTLVYTDGSTQLRTPSVQKMKMTTEAKVSGICTAFPSKTGATNAKKQLEFLFFPFNNSDKEIHNWARALINHVMMNTQTRKLCYGAQEMIQALFQFYKLDEKDVCCSCQVLDPGIASWLMNPDKPPMTFEDVVLKVGGLKREAHSDYESQVCSDVSLLGPVMMNMYSHLKYNKLWELFTKVESPLCAILAVMELRGIRIDTKALTKSADILKRKLSELESTAHQSIGHSFAINSHVQLRQILFEELKLDQQLSEKTKIPRTTVKNQKSTSEAVLLLLQDTHALPAIVLEHRQLQKLKSTYVDGMLSCVSDNWLFTHWDQTSAATGRLSSINPNIQSIPKQPVIIKSPKRFTQSFTQPEELEDVEIIARDPFICKEGHLLLAADFQQVELRILAHLSQDQQLVQIFKNPDCKDIFCTLTAQWLNKPIEDVTQSDREQTKRVVYSVMYGAGKDRLAEYLKISAEEAKNIMSSFLVSFPRINCFSRKCIEQTRNQGYQSTIFRRRRLFPHIKHPNGQLRAYAERQAVNFCVQGSAADLCKAAMIQVEQTLHKEALKSKLLVQIHDELLLETPEQELDTVAETVKRIMEDSSSLCGDMVELLVPLRVSLSVGKTWGHMETYITEKK